MPLAESAFGVVHKRIPDIATAAMPASSVRAYDYSHRHKKEAAFTNMAWKAGGAAVGSVVGGAATALGLRRIKGAGRLARLVSRPQVRGGVKVAAGSLAGGAVGTAAGSLHLKHVQRDPRYEYGRQG